MTSPLCWILLFSCLLRAAPCAEPSGGVKILYTAALIDFLFDMRKGEYTHCLEILSDYGYEPYIVEACRPSGPSFFEEYTPHVFYSNVNDWTLRNKGVNEAKSILEALKYYNFDEQQMVVKLTGRYFFNNRNFLELVENHPTADALIRVDQDGVKEGRSFSGCFALRCHLFKELIEGLDYKKMEEEMIDLEREIASFIATLPSKGYQVIYLPKSMSPHISLAGAPASPSSPNGKRLWQQHISPRPKCRRAPRKELFP